MATQEERDRLTRIETVLDSLTLRLTDIQDFLDELRSDRGIVILRLGNVEGRAVELDNRLGRLSDRVTEEREQSISRSRNVHDETMARLESKLSSKLAGWAAGGGGGAVALAEAIRYLFTGGLFN